VTLIACLHPHHHRVLLADILIFSNGPAAPEIELPTRAYVAPDQLRRMAFKPAAFRRKIVEISPSLLLLWAGDYNYATVFAKRAKAFFDGVDVNADTISNFVRTYYRTSANNFWALIIPFSGDWLCTVGDVTHSQSAFAEEYWVAGTGTDLFRQIVGSLSPRADGAIAPHIDGLRLANDLLAYEINTAQPILSQFGGGYEVFYSDQHSFHRVDDIMHFFVLVRRTATTNFHLSHYSHATRQWYEQDRLYIASFATPVGTEQGLGFVALLSPVYLTTTRSLNRCMCRRNI